MNIIKRSLSSIAMILAELLVGVLLLVDPVRLTQGIIVAFGAVLMLWGLFCVIKYFRTEAEAAAEEHAFVRGAALLLAGTLCAFCSDRFVEAFPVLTSLYGIVTLMGSMVKLQWTLDIIRLKRRIWLPAAASALVSAVCGILVIADPFTTITVLWTFTGISLIVEGALDLIAMLFGNRAVPPAEEKGRA